MTENASEATPSKPAEKRRMKGDGGLFERNGLWVGCIELPPGGDGKRRRREVSSKDKATAIAKMRDLRSKVDQGILPVTDRTTVAAWLERWLSEIMKPQLRPLTLRTYRSTVKCQIVPFIGKHKLGKLTPAHVRAMHRSILEDGKSSQTVLNAHWTLSRALGDAMREGMIPRNVAELVAPPKVLNETRDPLASSQARALLLTSLQWGDPYVTRWAAALLLGARQGEMLGLQWSRVDFDKGVLDLSWQLQRLPLKPGANPDDPKRFEVEAGFEHIPLYRGAALTRPKTSGSKRIVPLPVPLAAILLKLRERSDVNEFDLVWVSEQGRPIRPSDDDDAWRDALARADLPDDVDLHAARHTTATLLAEMGVEENVRMAIMGHSSYVAARGYTHVDQTTAAKALGNLSGLLSLEQ